MMVWRGAFLFTSTSVGWPFTMTVSVTFIPFTSLGRPYHTVFTESSEEGETEPPPCYSFGRTVSSGATMAIPTPMRFRPPTGETVDAGRAAGYLDRVLPPTSLGTTAVLILDLRGMGLIPGVLRELVVPLGQRIRGGMYG